MGLNELARLDCELMSWGGLARRPAHLIFLFYFLGFYNIITLNYIYISF